MAEVAAGAGIALAAEEVLSTTLQAGVATYFLTKPTQPLSATFTRIAVTDDEELHKRSLTRSNHTLTVVGSKAYIFGGETADGEIASNDMHIINLDPREKKEPEYQLIPALAGMGGSVPQARTNHAACAFNDGVVIYSGHSTNDGKPADEGIIWHFNPEKKPDDKTWSVLYSPKDHDDEVLKNGFQVRIFPTPTSLIILTGTEEHGIDTISKYTSASFPGPSSNRYEVLSKPPTATSASNAAFHCDHLYLISSPDAVSSQLHILPLNNKEGDTPKWSTLTFPTNPLVPGPRARHSGALLPITTGYGRNYLVYLLGARSSSTSTSTTSANFTEQDLSSLTSKEGKDEAEQPTQWSDTWILQLPSSNLEPQMSFRDAIKPAKIKDAIRAGVGADSGKWTWAEVEVRVPDDLGDASAGKLHPGPRAKLGADVMGDGKSVVFWGGENAEGEKVGDGWVVRLG